MMLHTPAPCLPEQTATTHLIVFKIRVTFTLCNLVQSLKHNRSCYEVAWHVFTVRTTKSTNAGMYSILK